MEKSNKWEGILYPENMRDDWQEVIEDYIPYPYVYCIHDRDKDGHEGDRKTHVHMIIITGDSRNRTTQKYVISVFNRLAKDGRICCPKAEPIWKSIRRAYDYLIHDTDKAKKQGKFQYSSDDRKTGNCFDIGDYETLTDSQKNIFLKELCDMILERNICDMAKVYEIVRDLDFGYWQVYKSYNSILRTLTEGVYHKWDRANKDAAEREDAKNS